MNNDKLFISLAVSLLLEPDHVAKLINASIVIDADIVVDANTPLFLLYEPLSIDYFCNP